jgi:hypothetical protein
MLVDVIRMRVKGSKVSKERLQAAEAVRGTLSVTMRLDYGQREQVIVASLVDVPRSQPLLPVLDHMRMPKLRGESFLLFGFEEIELTRRTVESFPQVWWCRLAREAVRTGDHAVDPAELEDLYELQP